MTDQVKHFLFVFGTLKTGYPNFRYNRAEKIAGDFQTLKRYPLYLVGNRQSPWLIDSPGEGFQVSGEVYRADATALSTMDALERTHETDGYQRLQIDVINRNNQQQLLIWTYMKAIEQLESAKIISGPFEQYTLEHARQYRNRNHGC